MLTMTDAPQLAKPPATGRKRVRAILLSDRIDTAQLEHDHVVSTVPLTYKFGKDGFVTLFRYGVAVMIGLTPEEEDEVLRGLTPRLIRPVLPREEESVLIDLIPDKDDQIMPGGPIALKAITPDSLVVIADALSKSVVLARDEREVAGVFDQVEPFARQLAEKGRARAGRGTILKQIGNALLVQQRVSGRVAVTDKPDVLWDRPDLERLYARIEDEYELKERADALFRKLSVLAETAQVLTDILDTKRSFRLEMIIVILIAVELLIAGYQTLLH
ncbi:MAG TPA: RMD1 family protein [Xanthobacteraceae bacterium]|nr:RMD1 family protein [Xanthobacteraceae bacterium]